MCETSVKLNPDFQKQEQKFYQHCNQGKGIPH